MCTVDTINRTHFLTAFSLALFFLGCSAVYKWKLTQSYSCTSYITHSLKGCVYYITQLYYSHYNDPLAYHLKSFQLQ